MPGQLRVLLVGGSGRTGLRVLEQLLGRGVQVRAIVRSRGRLPARLTAERGLSVVEADLLSLGDEELLTQVRGCDAVLSCLGHTINFKGIFGPPRDLVTRATRRLCQAIRSAQPGRPVKFVLMSSVSVNHPEIQEARRGTFERLALWMLRGMLPPARDNQRAADYLYRTVGTRDPHIEWVVVRPDTLLVGDPSQYALHEAIVSRLSKPDTTNMANVACFMCDLATSEETWRTWTGKLPVIVNAPPQTAGVGRPTQSPQSPEPVGPRHDLVARFTSGFLLSTHRRAQANPDLLAYELGTGAPYRERGLTPFRDASAR